MTRLKNHHFVPAAHIAQWSDQPARRRRESLVPVFDKSSGRSRGLSKAANLARERDLYAARLGDVANRAWFDTMDQLLESFLSHLPNTDIEKVKAEAESVGMRAMCAVDEWTPESIDGADRVAVTRYVGLLIAQHPLMLRARRPLFDRLFAERLTRAMGHAMTEEQQAVLRHPAWEHMGKGVVLVTLHVDAQVHASLLQSYGCTVLRRASPPFFLYGDAGVFAVHAGVRGPGPGDLADRRSRVLVPCSPRTALIFRPEEGDYYREATEHDVRQLNQIVWNRSAREIYGKDLDTVDRSKADGEPGLQFVPRAESFPFDIRHRA
ncbi:MAG: DUF4238 domain-containing protein [Candidatus Limnocylindrales bacterium]|jgi:hypothetical protein